MKNWRVWGRYGWAAFLTAWLIGLVWFGGGVIPARAGVLGDEIKREKWDNLDVVWLEDPRLPLYTINIYFSDGALSDGPNNIGETNAVFDLLESGTNRYDQTQIKDALDYFGAHIASQVTHEYSSIAISGLVKDIVPTMTMMCHLFSDSTFPKEELKKYQTRFYNEMNNLMANPGKLADRVFRELTLRDTPFGFPAEGNKKGVKQLTSEGLKNKLNYLNKSVKKRIYIAGPSIIKIVEKIFSKDCQWGSSSEKFVRSVDKTLISKAEKKRIFFAPIKKANQAQIRVGGRLYGNDLKDPDLLGVGAAHLGGGFTSLLMEALRKKNPYTYGVYAYAVPQKGYGRRGIVTSTRNETVVPVVKEIERVISGVSLEGNARDLIENTKSFLAGSFLFPFEEKVDFVERLLFYDHVGRSYADLYNYSQIVKTFKPDDVVKKLREVFSWDRQTILILGDDGLLKNLQKLGPIIEIKYQDYL